MSKQTKSRWGAMLAALLVALFGCVAPTAPAVRPCANALEASQFLDYRPLVLGQSARPVVRTEWITDRWLLPLRSELVFPLISDAGVPLGVMRRSLPVTECWTLVDSLLVQQWARQ